MRASASYWPVLDEKLNHWVNGILAIKDHPPITGPLIQIKASELWMKISEYCDEPKPQFSDGWLYRFKRRHGIQYYIYHGESASVPTSIHEDIKPIQAICDQFKPEDIYNMDETGLYWRRMPNGSLD